MLGHNTDSNVVQMLNKSENRKKNCSNRPCVCYRECANDIETQEVNITCLTYSKNQTTSLKSHQNMYNSKKQEQNQDDQDFIE